MTLRPGVEGRLLALGVCSQPMDEVIDCLSAEAVEIEVEAQVEEREVSKDELQKAVEALDEE